MSSPGPFLIGDQAVSLRRNGRRYALLSAAWSVLRMQSSMEIYDATIGCLFRRAEVLHKTLHIVVVLGRDGILGLPDFLNDLILHLGLPSTPEECIFPGTHIL